MLSGVVSLVSCVCVRVRLFGRLSVPLCFLVPLLLQFSNFGRGVAVPIPRVGNAFCWLIPRIRIHIVLSSCLTGEMFLRSLFPSRDQRNSCQRLHLWQNTFALRRLWSGPSRQLTTTQTTPTPTPRYDSNQTPRCGLIP